MKRGRPKGRSNDTRSYGPLGDLIRKRRIELGLGLSDVAKSCNCSVQFISNIEHGRAPLPWEKSEDLSRALGLSLDELQAANLSIRADFKSFMVQAGPVLATGTKKVSKTKTEDAQNSVQDTASLVALTAKDPQLRALLLQYQLASPASRKKFHQTAKRTLN